jgi:hypothetical protein
MLPVKKRIYLKYHYTVKIDGKGIETALLGKYQQPKMVIKRGLPSLNPKKLTIPFIIKMCVLSSSLS